VRRRDTFLFFLAWVTWVHAEELPLTLAVKPHALSETIKPGDTLNAIRFLGMVEVPSVSVLGKTLSELSGLAFDEDENLLYAVSDKGTLFHLRPEFSSDYLTGLTLLAVYPLLDLKTQAPLKGTSADSEGLEILNGRNGKTADAQLLVSFERAPRIVRYRPDGRPVEALALPEPLKNPKAYAQDNKMLESVCQDETLGVLTTPEAPLSGSPKHSSSIYSLSGERWLIPLDEGRNVTAIECLGQGRVLMLERDFGRIPWRSLSALKRAALNPGGSPYEPVAVETLVTLDVAKKHLVDNFEGMTHHRGNRFFLVSDNNRLPFQRTLLFYFEILEAPSTN
jgi:hypothetical protein